MHALKLQQVTIGKNVGQLVFGLEGELDAGSHKLEFKAVETFVDQLDRGQLKAQLLSCLSAVHVLDVHLTAEHVDANEERKQATKRLKELEREAQWRAQQQRFLEAAANTHGSTAPKEHATLADFHAFFLARMEELREATEQGDKEQEQLRGVLKKCNQEKMQTVVDVTVEVTCHDRVRAASGAPLLTLSLTLPSRHFAYSVRHELRVDRAHAGGRDGGSRVGGGGGEVVADDHLDGTFTTYAVLTNPTTRAWAAGLAVDVRKSVLNDSLSPPPTPQATASLSRGTLQLSNLHIVDDPAPPTSLVTIFATDLPFPVGPSSSASLRMAACAVKAFRRVLVPEARLCAFAEAVVRNEGEVELEGGPVEVVCDGKVVGQHAIGGIRPGKAVRIGVGRDDKVKVEFEKDVSREVVGEAGGRIKYQLKVATKTTITNTNPHAVSCVFRHQIPSPSTVHITVRVEQPQREGNDLANLEQVVQLGAGASEQIVVSYVLEWKAGDYMVNTGSNSFRFPQQQQQQQPAQAGFSFGAPQLQQLQQQQQPAASPFSFGAQQQQQQQQQQQAPPQASVSSFGASPAGEYSRGKGFGSVIATKPAAKEAAKSQPASSSPKAEAPADAPGSPLGFGRSSVVPSNAGSAFGSSNAGSGAFGSSNAGGGGFGSSNAGNSFGGFGQVFSSSNTSGGAFSSGGFGFGAQPSASSGGGGFGGPSPFGAASTPSFGQARPVQPNNNSNNNPNNNGGGGGGFSFGSAQ